MYSTSKSMKKTRIFLHEAVKAIAPTFGGINLEDIKAPECFEIERRLKEELDIPVMHDDQHGTAIISSAGLVNALQVAGKKIEDVKIDNLLDKFKEVNTSDKELKEFIEKQYNNLLKEKEKIKDGGKLYTKITDLLTNNSVINKSASKMNDKELLTFITRYILVPLPPPIKQEDFNDLVKVGIKEDNREALWRLAVNYNKKMDFTLIEDYFIDKRDSYYLIELISATDSVNLDNIVSKVVATNDREFMIDLANRSLELSIFAKDDIDKIKEKYNL